MAISPKIILPTGFEGDRRKAEQKRKIAQALMEKGLNGGNMTHWTQALAQMGNAWAGKRMDKKATQMDVDTDARLSAAYAEGLGALKQARAEGRSSGEIMEEFQGNPLLTDAIDPEKDAFGAGLKDKQGSVNFGGQWRAKGGIREGEFEPNKPDASVWRDEAGNAVVNSVGATAAQSRQGIELKDPVLSSPIPGSNMPPQGAAPLMPPAAPAGPMGGGDGLDLSVLSPEERAIMSQEIARRKAGPGSGYTPPNPNTPMGSPLSAQRAPAGVVNGKPYWIINGVPYDNAEGK